MRIAAALLLAIASWPALAAAQGWDPAAAYIAPGQDETGYRAWYLTDPARRAAVASYYAFLRDEGVAGVVPTWQLLRTATDWRTCAAEPFAVPPAELWPHIAGTLRWIRAHVIPVVGPVEPVSVYRDPALNACAHGAPLSAHMQLTALDLVPLRPVSREGLIRAMCAIHGWRGDGYAAGLGFYRGVRFHVDTNGFRSWLADGSGNPSPCPAIMAELARLTDIAVKK